MTTSLPKREADGRSFLESFPRWATDAPTVLAVLGIVLYAVLRIAYSLFYNNFGLTPDDLGLSYLDLLIQSAVGTVILLMVMFVVAAFVVSVYVGMFGQLRMQIRMLWNNFFRMRHAKSTGSERRPSAKQEGESVPPRWPDRPGRQQHAGSSGWERRPSAKQEGESVPPRWPDRPGRRVNGLALSDQVWAEQVELESPDDVGDARLAGSAGREVAGFLGLAGAGPVRAVPGEGARGEDLEQERGEREISLLRGKKPRPCPSRRPGRAGS